MSGKTQYILIHLAIIFIAIGLIWWGLFNTKITSTPNESHNKQQAIIDSLEQVVKQERKARELAERKFEQSDSLARVFWDSLNQQFNDDEKDARLRAVNELDDSASFEFFSKWLSESDGD